MNAIYLRRKRKLYVKAGDGWGLLTHVATIQKNIESLGFVMSDELIQRLLTIGPDKLATFYKLLIKDLRELVGAHRKFKPMYRNFPKQVMEMSEGELYLNAILHYMTLEIQEREKIRRPKLIENTDLRLINLGTKEDFENIFTRLAGARSSLSPEDKSDTRWFVAQYGDDIERMLPVEVPFKENLAVVGAELLVKTDFGERWVRENLATATDVLRLAVALSGDEGDVSLAEASKFRNFTRSERKSLLGFVETTSNTLEDMRRWPERWKRLGEKLHPGDYSKRFPKTFAAFAALRNNEPSNSFNAQVERKLLAEDYSGALSLLQSRPGELARRLDCLLRKSPKPSNVVQAFASVCQKISTPVMLQVMTHFQNRQNNPPELRSFFPKGSVASVFAIPNRLPRLDGGLIRDVVQACRGELLRRFGELEPLGKCYIDPLLENQVVPFSQRSASKALRTIVRGSRLSLPEANVVRFFIWWKNGTSRTDLDLSAALYDKNYKFIDIVSYYNLKSFGGHHSGDIVDAPNGAAEFIDLSIKKCKAKKVRYVVVSLNNYTNQPFCDLPECFAGWMSRKKPNSGEIFEPKTVVDRFDVASTTRMCIPMILDFVAKEIIWTDIALTSNAALWNNVHNNLCGVSLMLRSMVNLRKTNLHTLFDLHAQSRGTITDSLESADTVFSMDEGITPRDGDRITSEFL